MKRKPLLPEITNLVECIERPDSAYRHHAKAARAELRAVESVLRQAYPIAKETWGLVGACGPAAHLDRAFARLEKVTGRRKRKTTS